MEGKMLARVGAVVFVAVAITATVIELTRKEDAPVAMAIQPRPAIDPMRALLRQCRDMGEPALRNPVCLRVWAQNRDRFLGQHPTSGPSSSTPPAETTPAEDLLRKEGAPAANAPVQLGPAQTEAR
ncbi:putative entry exclusion protein TrbK-alt [Rhodopseudomonas sp. G2_2311]|uniref:putative entry exclusion protein TrbK-alt n=1 Tax=Rhodopseudomonas sp. G2_2311 TaxID=3114287 RepID=UPI0039C75DA0